MSPLAVLPLVALRLAAKGLRRSVGTTTLAVFVLALGLAAPATFFSLLVGAIRPLPVPEGDRVARIDVVQPERDGRALALLLDDLSTLAGSSSLEALGAFQVLSGTLVEAGTSATRVSAAALTPEVLPMLRVEPLLGRMPGANDAAQAVLLGYDIWQESYSGDASVLGRAVEFNDLPSTIVGVMPDGFAFPYKQNTWTVLDATQVSDEPVELVARLADGSSFAAASAELAVRWSQADAARNVDRTGGVLVVDRFTGGRGEGGEAVAFLGLVLVALCLLLIACANVANLLLVRATERVRALSIQAALGASRAQIGGQLLLEALVISVLGGAAGLFVAWLGVDAIQTQLAAEHWGYYWMDMAIDGRVFVFTSILVVGTALVSGMLPALRIMKVDVQQVLKEESAGSSVGGGSAWGRAFVTIQLALSCGALVAAGLTGRAMNASRNFAGSLPTDEILLATVPLARDNATSRSGLEDALTERMAALPGVSVAALALGAPAYFEPYGTLEFDGTLAERVSDRERGAWNAVTPDYFRVLDLDLLAGRALASEDRAGTAPVAVVNESFVTRFRPDEDILGRTIRVGARPDSAVWHTVVGIVSDARVGVGERVRHDRVYLPLPQVETGVRAPDAQGARRRYDRRSSLAPGGLGRRP